MARLTLRLLGPMQAAKADGAPLTFAYDKVRALCAYLAVEHEQAHPRTRLAGLLWPEYPESAARHSLSQALSSLRATFDDRNQSTPLLKIDRQSVQFRFDDDCWVDLLEFRKLLPGSGHAANVLDPAAATSDLQRAIGLYRGPFLEGLSLEDCAEFEDWQRSVQESTSRTYSKALSTLVSLMEQQGDLIRASGYAERLIEFDPWEEQHHRTLMRLLAMSGRRTTAMRQFERCREMLERELGLEPEPETIELAAEIRLGMYSDQRPVELPEARRYRSRPVLPEPASPIIGREAELEEISHALTLGESRLLTLIGPGGIGKSRLALEAARAVQDDMPDGVYFVPLAGVQSSDSLVPAILNAVAADVEPRGDSLDQLKTFLHARQVLLLLDNFEHLLDGALTVSELLEESPGLRVLVTSRERLLLSSETVMEVDGLDVPEDADGPAIATSPAVRLFMLRGRKHKTSFLPRAQDGPALARIARLTGGMPLALELAAAWVPVLSPNEIADEIEQSLDFLTVTVRDLPERHRSVSAVVERSWDNLSEIEQRTYRRLSVFQGGFTRKAAGFVAGATLPVLSALVSKSLVRHTQSGRYEIHELLRQFAARHLAEDRFEEDVVRERHRDYYLGFLEDRQHSLQSATQKLALSEIAEEIDNIRAAWSFAIDTGEYADLSRATHALWLFCDISDRYSEGARFLERAYTGLRSLEGVSSAQQDDYRLALARFRSRQSALSFRVVGPALLRELLIEPLAIVRELDEPSELGLQLNYLACVYHTLGNRELEERYLMESIEQFERAEDWWGIAYSRNDLGQLRTLQGRYVEARELHQAALAILEDLGDIRGIAFALRNLGIVASHLGSPDQALELLRRSVDIRRPIGNQWGIAESLNQIGMVLRDRNDLKSAAECFREALQIAREIGAMQLASEILREYLPLLPVAFQNEISASGATERIVREGHASEQQIAGIRGLVDSVLGDGASFDGTYGQVSEIQRDHAFD